MTKSFRLPRPVFSLKMQQLITRELRLQKTALLTPTLHELKEMKKIASVVKKLGIRKDLVCRELPHGLGKGIFLHPKAKKIQKGEIIGSYAGEVCFFPQNVAEDCLYAFEPLFNMHLTQEEQAHFDPKRPYHPKRLYCFLIDALKQGNFTRFVNHSDRPNLFAEFFKIPGKCLGFKKAPLEVIYVTKKTIYPGEQLLVSYEGDDHSYWTGLKLKPFPMTPKTFQLDASLNLLSTTSVCGTTRRSLHNSSIWKK